MEKVKLSDIIQETITGEWGTDIKKDENDVYVIRTADFCNDGTINYDKVEKRNIAEKKIKEKSLVIGDIIIEKSGGTDKNPVGRVVLFNKENYKCLANNFTQVLRVKNEYYYKYIFYQLFYKYKCGATLQMFNQTTGIQNLQMKIYLNQKLNTYIKEEQIEIANKLDKVQEIIGIRKKQIEELDELIKSQFVEMFKDSKKIKLCEMANITMGQSPDSSSYNDNGEGLPFFQGKADYGEKYTIVRQWTSKPSKLANNGDVLMSVRAPVGPVNISSCDCCIGRGLCAISAKDGITNNEFIYNSLNAIQDEISLMGTGSTFKAITKNDVFSIEIPFASIELQNKFAEFVKQIDKQKFEIQKNLEEMQKLQESLMNKYFG